MDRTNQKARMAYGNDLALLCLDAVDYAFTVSAFLDLLDGDRIEIFFDLMPVDGVFNIYECIGVCVRQSEDVFFAVARDDFMSVLRIEVLEFLDRGTGKVGNLSEMELPVDSEGIYMYRHLDSLRLYAMFLVICHCI